jgi:hypothetical protein
MTLTIAERRAVDLQQGMKERWISNGQFRASTLLAGLELAFSPGFRR